MRSSTSIRNNSASWRTARATTATLRTHLINIPGRVAGSARRLTVHLPERWPWQIALTNLHAAVTAIARPPTVTA